MSTSDKHKITSDKLTMNTDEPAAASACIVVAHILQALLWQAEAVIASVQNGARGSSCW